MSAIATNLIQGFMGFMAPKTYSNTDRKESNNLPPSLSLLKY